MAEITNQIKKHKLITSFFLIIGLFIAFGAITTYGLGRLGELTLTIYKHPLVVSNASLNAALNITKMHRNMKDVVLAISSDERENVLWKIAEEERKVYRQLNLVRDNILGVEGQALEKETRQLFSNWAPIRNEVVTLLESDQTKEAILITKEKSAYHVAKLDTKMFELTSYARNKADGFLKLAELNQLQIERATFYLTIAGVLLSIVIAVITAHFVISSEKALQDKNQKLKQALDEIRTLHGIIPICSNCKQIRDDKGAWKQLEEYIQTHSEAKFSHSLCPHCLAKLYPEYSDMVEMDMDNYK
ncbi:MAG: MCP four helix bundle domain-containing protein [Desulfobacteraceae bacterium]|jgi:hypothetical protein